MSTHLFLCSNPQHLKQAYVLRDQRFLDLKRVELLVIQKKGNKLSIQDIDFKKVTHLKINGKSWSNVLTLRRFLKQKVKQTYDEVFMSTTDYVNLSLLNKLDFRCLSVFDDGIGVINMAKSLINGQFDSPYLRKYVTSLFRPFGVKYSFRYKSASKPNIYTRFYKHCESYAEDINIHQLKPLYEEYSRKEFDAPFLIGQPYLEAKTMSVSFLKNSFARLKEHYKKVYYLAHPAEKTTALLAREFFDTHPTYDSFGKFDKEKCLPGQSIGFTSSVLYDIFEANEHRDSVTFLFLEEGLEQFFSAMPDLMHFPPEENRLLLK